MILKRKKRGGGQTSCTQFIHFFVWRWPCVLYTHFSECALFFAVGVSETKHVLYLTPGNDVIMPCDNVPDTCSMVIWAYSKHESQTINMVHNGIVEKNSAQADRLSLHSNCSLSINNITAEDAGQYFCRPEGNADQDTTVDLNILTSEYLDFHGLPYIHICEWHRTLSIKHTHYHHTYYYTALISLYTCHVIECITFLGN